MVDDRRRGRYSLLFMAAISSLPQTPLHYESYKAAAVVVGTWGFTHQVDILIAPRARGVPHERLG